MLGHYSNASYFKLPSTVVIYFKTKFCSYNFRSLYVDSESLGVHAIDELEEELLGEPDLVHLGDPLDPLQDVLLLLLHVRSEICIEFGLRINTVTVGYWDIAITVTGFTCSRKRIL